MITLYINTTDRFESVIRLSVDKKSFEKKLKSEKPMSEKVLVLIKSVCDEAKINIQDINRVEVSTGPGSYTGIRVGIAIANALGVFAHAKINGQNFGKLAEATYS